MAIHTQLGEKHASGYYVQGDSILVCPPNPSEAILQAAIDALTTGGEVRFYGDCSVTAGLTVKKGVLVRGFGAYGRDNLGVYAPKSRLVWAGGAGAGALITFAPTEGGALPGIKRGGLVGVEVDGASNANYGLVVKSCQFSRFEDLTFFNCRIAHVDVGVVTTLGDTRDTQQCIFENLYIEQYSNGTSYGIRLDGDATANPSFNSFRNLNIRMMGGGPGLYLGGCDNNDFVGVRVQRSSGAAYGVEFSGTADHVARSNYFLHLASHPAGVIARTGSYNNAIYGYDQENSDPDPVLEASSSLLWLAANRFLSGPLTVSSGLVINNEGAGADVTLRSNSAGQIANIAGTLRPDTDDTFDLGDSGRRFSNIYVRTVRGTVAPKSANSNLAVNQAYVPATGGAGGITLTLPTPVGADGCSIRIKKVDAAAGAITVATAAGNIDGSATKTISTQNEGYEFVSDGTNWMVF